MAPRKNAKGGGGNSNSSSTSSSPSSCTSGGGSSSPGARKETKHGGHKNGRKGGLSGSSFFTWFMVIALLGVWTSVAVVWFDLVDYEEVLAKAKDFRYNLSEVLQGKLGIYDADGDGDFDVDDAKVLLGFKERSAPKPTVPPEEAEPYPWLEDQVLEGPGPQNIEDEVQEQVQSLLDETVYAEHGEDLHQEQDGPAGELQPEDGIFAGSDTDDRYEPVGTGAVHEVTEDSYHVEETASPAYSQDMGDMIYEQENPESSELVVDDAGRMDQEADDITYQEYDEQAFEPSENEGTENSDNAVDDSNTILEEVHVPRAEEQREVPPETNKKTDDPEKKEKGHMRGSLLTLQKLVQLFPDDTSLKNDLGVGYLLMGDNDSAKKVYEEVLNVTPNDGFAKVHYGFILKAQNKIAESIPYLKEGIESGDPGTDDGRFYFHLGDAMQRVGNKEAYKWYELGHQRGHFASVWQRSLYNVHGLKAQPWWTPKETGYTELVKSLERNWKLIRDEGLAVMDRAQSLFLPEDENLREKGDWSQFTLWQQGRKNENACKGARKTCSLLDKFPETTGCRRGQIKYSVMHPGTHVWPHTGPTNCRLRMHLGLVIPKEGCKIRCANETKTWEEGKVLIFDDSFEHEVWQDATSFRLIFIVDVWHPELTPHQRRSLPAI
ncbi:aspartyl/asparaginyl beta-hydroxylase isoform X9 [Delphinapterus leucas]|uniref:Aspartyl/asparaginyl beta-hydroxylase isoform X9 n=1 Tax=Delphinapterus leucas TaxID=9749 RepID=A0A2Y9Q0S2_DELLE|nr:aspartyl/asparaginyl beta-hydroxylase isoform X9 [Delphinapterus leucas]